MRSARLGKSSYARALRRLAKRKEAIASVEPFLVAIVAVGDSFLYIDGKLLYILDRNLRILDLHNSGETELVIPIRTLLDDSLEESLGTAKYKFYLVHYADGIVSCRYTHSNPETESWLIAFDPHQSWVLTHPLVSTYKLFVRNTRDYLYYGTHSDFGDDGFRRWALKGYSFAEDRWSQDWIHLSEMVGSDIGNNVCFEIFDNCFYGAL